MLGDTGGGGGQEGEGLPADVPLTSYWCGSGPSPARRLAGWRWWLAAAVEPIGRQLQGDTHQPPDIVCVCVNASSVQQADDHMTLFLKPLPTD